MSTITVQKTAEDVASKSLKVTVPADHVRTAEAKAVRYYAKQARLPGFRPGKAPEAVVRKRFNEAIRQAVLEQVIRESWDVAKASEDLKPIADPSIKNLKFEEGADVEFDLVVEVKPTLALGTTGGFALEKKVPVVDDAAVQEQLDQIREQKAAWLPAEGKPAPGQLVRVEVAPIGDDGQAAEAQPYNVVLGQNQAIPELEERIMALEPGQTVDTEVKFPEDHPDASRRGQARKVRVTLHEVKTQELPALDDAFARELGDFDSVDALRAQVRKDLEANAAREADADVRQQLIEKLVEANGVPAPHSLVHRLLHGYANMYQVPQDQFAAFEAQFEPMAEQQVRRELIIEAVLDAQPELRATEGDVDARIAEMAEARKVSAGQLYQTLQKNDRLGELERSISEEKAFAWLLGQSTVTEVAS